MALYNQSIVEHLKGKVGRKREGEVKGGQEEACLLDWHPKEETRPETGAWDVPITVTQK